jgi:isocitrate/isopropylmalate dehydrogenase
LKPLVALIPGDGIGKAVVTEARAYWNAPVIYRQVTLHEEDAGAPHGAHPRPLLEPRV